MDKKDVRNMSPFEAAVWKIDKYLGLAERGITSVFLLGVVATVLVGIVLRFFLRAPNKYGEEISRYLLIGCVYIGVSIGVREKAHLGIDSLVNALPKKAAKKVRFVADLVSFAMYIVLIMLSFSYISYQKGQYSPSMTFLPMYFVYTLLFIGFVLASLRSLMMIWNDYFSKNKVLSPEQETVVIQ